MGKMITIAGEIPILRISNIHLQAKDENKPKVECD
jgi:hypothetical protein